MPTSAQQAAYDEWVNLFQNKSGFGINPETQIVMADAAIPDYYGITILPSGEVVDQRRITGGNFVSKYINPVMQVAGQALPYVGAAMTGVGLAQGAGLLGNIGTASASGAGAGAGEMATYGMGGSGLSGTGALAGSTPALADIAPSIIDTWTPGSIGGLGAVDAGAMAAMPEGAAAGLGTLTAAEGAGLGSGLLSNLTPAAKSLIAKTVGGLASSALTGGNTAGVAGGTGNTAGSGYSSRSGGLLDTAAPVAALTIAAKQKEEEDKKKKMTWMDWLNMVNSMQRDYYGDGTVLA